jgi:hypothetical protein
MQRENFIYKGSRGDESVSDSKDNKNDKSQFFFLKKFLNLVRLDLESPLRA